MRRFSVRRIFVRELPLVAVLSGVVYACSGTANVSTKRDGVGTGGSAASASGGTGNSSATGTGGGGNAINLGGKSGGKAGSTGGGSSAQGGSSAAGEEQGGLGDAPSFGGFPDVTFDYEPDTGGQGGACATETGQATLVKRPMDVIIAIDNSASMQGEIQAVQARINTDFANIINASGIDYRVILVSRYGNIFVNNYDGGAAGDSAFSVCIGSPLSSLACPADQNAATPAIANTPPRFYHHSTDISSHNMWCALTKSYGSSDPISTHGRAGWAPVAPNGWKDFLRPDAYKVFIGITDDRPDSGECPGLTNNLAGATAFDTALRALDPAQFQTAAGDRNYTWYSIVGMHADQANAVLEPSDPVGTQCCTAAGTAAASCQGTFGNKFADSAYPGEGYQELSIMTGGLRYPSCYNSNFDDIFNAIAQGVIEGAKASCVYDVPEPEHGIVDDNQTKVSYKPSSGAEVPLPRRSSEAACATDAGFYYSGSGDDRQINLCPATCVVVQADPLAKVGIDFGCLGS